MTWRIEGLAVASTPEASEIGATIGGYRVWYRVPAGTRFQLDGSTFLAAALIPAMAAGEDLVIDPELPVSPRLLEATEQLQGVWHQWGKVWGRAPFTRIRVTAGAMARPEGLVPGPASFFSGGVDSSYTYHRHRHELTHIIHGLGVDMQLANAALYDEVSRKVAGFAAANGKQAVMIATNVRFFGHERANLSWLRWNGAGLASMGLLLGFERLLIPGTYDYSHLRPTGTHVLTDPLWSTEATSISYDGGEAGRLRKVEVLGAEAPELLNMLRVCWQDAGYNCGTCEKCLRTRLELRVLGLTTPTLPPLRSLDELRHLHVRTEGVADFQWEVLEAAEHRGDRELIRYLRRGLARFTMLQLGRDFDRLLLGGRVAAWRRAQRRQEDPARTL